MPSEVLQSFKKLPITRVRVRLVRAACSTDPTEGSNMRLGKVLRVGASAALLGVSPVWAQTAPESTAETPAASAAPAGEAATPTAEGAPTAPATASAPPGPAADQPAGATDAAAAPAPPPGAATPSQMDGATYVVRLRD